MENKVNMLNKPELARETAPEESLNYLSQGPIGSHPDSNIHIQCKDPADSSISRQIFAQSTKVLKNQMPFRQFISDVILLLINLSLITY